MEINVPDIAGSGHQVPAGRRFAVADKLPRQGLTEDRVRLDRKIRIDNDVPRRTNGRKLRVHWKLLLLHIRENAL